MIRLFKYMLLVVVTSLYVFPIEFSFFPIANTKMIMAAMGIVTFVVKSILTHQVQMNRKHLIVGLYALGVSFCGLISVLYNNANDYSYATYIISFLVWIVAAYFVVSCYKWVHSYVSVTIVCNYLIAVAIMQCIFAIMIEHMPIFKNMVNSIVIGFASMYSAGEGLDNAGRLYGIGAALDVAGTRFCAILSMISIMAYNAYKKNNNCQQILYILCLLVLLVIGSMMSRTTSVGMLFVLLYFIVIWYEGGKKYVAQFFAFFAVAVLLLAVLYNSNSFFYDNLRFAFEGFFNLAETGTWRLNSTDELQSMYIWPESFKTWVIGDGYFLDPYSSNPYYVGDVRSWGMFYMGTDVGYLRFIYYFGLLGLLLFICYFVHIERSLVKRFSTYKWVFRGMLLMTLLIWFKVSTDIFCLYALFLCIDNEENDAYEKQYENSLPDPLDI